MLKAGTDFCVCGLSGLRVYKATRVPQVLLDQLDLWAHSVPQAALASLVCRDIPGVKAVQDFPDLLVLQELPAKLVTYYFSDNINIILFYINF